MNYQQLFNHLENISEENKNYHKEIHNILYFNNEKFLENPDFLNHENNDKDFFDININKKTLEDMIEVKNNFKNFSQEIDTLFDIQNFNVSNKFKSLVDCVLSIIDYKNINGKVELFQKMLRDFDSLKLFKKFKFQKRKICKKSVIRDLLLTYNDDDEIMKYFLSNYLSVNLVLLENDSYKLYCENDTFEPFKTTIMIYRYEKMYYYLSSKDNNKLFTSDDDFVIRLYNLQDNEDEEEEEVKKIDTILEIQDMIGDFNLEPTSNPKMNIQEIVEEFIDEIKQERLIEEKPIPIEEKTTEQVNYSLMKVTELKKLCKERKIKGYSKLKKKELIELLEK